MVLRFVGRYEASSDTCQAILRSYPSTHPFAGLSGTENIITFTTKRYSDPPLTIRGPGAGPAVTAAGIFGDIISLSRML